MKKILLFTFYGMDCHLQVPEDVSEKEMQKRFEDWCANEKAYAVQKYKDELFMQQIKVEHDRRKSIYLNFRKLFKLN